MSGVKNDDDSSNTRTGYWDSNDGFDSPLLCSTGPSLDNSKADTVLLSPTISVSDVAHCRRNKGGT